MKIDIYQFIKNWIPRAIIFATIILVILNLYFIYQNVWQVYNYSKKSAVLENEVVPAELKFDLFKKIEGKLEQKNDLAIINFGNLKNPFSSESGETTIPEEPTPTFK
jgi:hypothetical protein